MRAWFERRWYSREPPPALLLPLSWLYGRVAARRRCRQQSAREPLPVPVIVVGNIALGGTGKTPLVIWLVERLRDWGFTPGVISRGYGGAVGHRPLAVTPDSDPALCGDEPLLIALRTGAPLVVSPDRVAAARRLLAGSAGVDVIVSDDGLQHYRLPRDLEFGVIDGARGLGNAALLPAGPLREPPERLRELDWIVVNGREFDSGLPQDVMELQAGAARSLLDPQRRCTLAAFADRKIHAVAGIGNPERFFASLEAAGLRIERHAFADHHRYTAVDFDFGDGLDVLMTEKDAVKCRRFADARLWYLPVSARLDRQAEARVRECCQRLRAVRP